MILTLQITQVIRLTNDLFTAANIQEYERSEGPSEYSRLN